MCYNSRSESIRLLTWEQNFLMHYIFCSKKTMLIINRHTIVITKEQIRLDKRMK